jgi:hypothetical protein
MRHSGDLLVNFTNIIIGLMKQIYINELNAI